VDDLVAPDAGDRKALFRPRDGVVSWKLSKGEPSEADIFLENGGENEVLSGLAFVSEARAIRNSHAIIVSTLESGVVGPSHKEISVVSKAGGVAVGIDELQIGVVSGLEIELEEDREDGLGVGRWAHSKVEVTDGGIGNVALVVGGIYIDAVPARREVNLGANLVAPRSGEPVLLARGSVDATHIDSSVGEIFVAIRGDTASGITGDHVEAFGRGKLTEIGIAFCEVSNIITGPPLVINSRSTEGNQLELSIRTQMIKLGNPVIRVIGDLVASGGIGNQFSIGGRHFAAERVSSDDAVYMGTRSPKVNNGVGALGRKRGAIYGKETQEGIG